MRMPELTPLQFIALHALFGGPKRPAELRDALRELGIARSLSAFSRLIRRMEYGQWLSVEHDRPTCRVLGDCRLAVTDVGVAVWEATRKFYADLSVPAEVAPVATEAGKLAHLPARDRRRVLDRRDAKELRKVLMGLVRSRWPRDR